MKKIIIDDEMKNLVLFRGTKEEICEKINSIGLRSDSILEPFENSLSENDFGFNTYLGKTEGHYLDFEVYLLPTNKKDVFLVTEVNEL